MKNLQELQDLVSNQEIENAFKGTNFGSELSRRQIIANGVLKYASGYHSGSTLQAILKELGLLTIKLSLTKKGKAYLWSSFANNISV